MNAFKSESIVSSQMGSMTPFVRDPVVINVRKIGCIVFIHNQNIDVSCRNAGWNRKIPGDFVAVAKGVIVYFFDSFGKGRRMHRFSFRVKVVRIIYGGHKRFRFSQRGAYRFHVIFRLTTAAAGDYERIWRIARPPVRRRIFGSLYKRQKKRE